MLWSRLKKSRQLTDFAGPVRAAVIFFVSCMVGCGSGASGPGTSMEAEHIGKVAQLIGDFKSANSGNNPKNIEDLKNWAINNGKAEEKDFLSTRDKKEYVIEPMAMMRGAGPGGEFMAQKMPVVLHEAEGKNGKKFVIQGTAPIGSEMSDEGLNSLTKGRANKQMSTR
jgi:hypothetical protein